MRLTSLIVLLTNITSPENNRINNLASGNGSGSSHGLGKTAVWIENLRLTRAEDDNARSNPTAQYAALYHEAHRPQRKENKCGSCLMDFLISLLNSLDYE